MWIRVVSVAAVFAIGCGDNSRPQGVGEMPDLEPRTLDKKARTEVEEPKFASSRAGRDVTAAAKQRNSDTYAKPTNDFRPGHASKGHLASSAIQRTSNGFNVRFPSGAPMTSPVYHNGNIYVGGGFKSREFYAFNAKTGALKFAVALNDDGPSTAACADQTCVINTESCTIFAINSETGAQKWSLWMGDPMTASPSIANGKVFTSFPASGRKNGEKAAPANMTHVISALELETGNVIWQKWLDSDIMTAPVANGGFVYVTTFSGTIYKFDENDGSIVTTRRDRATSAPIVVDGQLMFSQRVDGHGEGAKEALAIADAKTGEKLEIFGDKTAPYIASSVQLESNYAAQGKENDAANGFGGGAPAQANAQAAMENIGQGSVSTMQAYQGSMVVLAGDMMISTMGDEVVGFNKSTGKKAWSVPLKGDIKAGGSLGAPPVVAGGKAIVATLDGNILQIDAQTGKVVETTPVGHKLRSQPVVWDGWIYAGTENGRLVAINTGDKSVTGWPQWGKDAQRSGY